MSKKNFNCKKLVFSQGFYTAQCCVALGHTWLTAGTGLTLRPGATDAMEEGHHLGNNPLWNLPSDLALPGWELPIGGSILQTCVQSAGMHHGFS